MNWNEVNIDEVVDKSKVIPSFLVYYLKSPCFEKLMHSPGSSPGFYPESSVKKKIQLPLPPLKEQKRIVFILSSYDSLIANNNRRIELLEKAVKEHYNHWFVRLKFPGHQKVAINGGIPDGWKHIRLAQLVDSAICGYTASADKKHVGPKFLQIKDILTGQIDWNSVGYCKIVRNKLDKYLLKKGDIVVVRNGVKVGIARRIHRNCSPAVCASFFIRFRIRGADDLYIGHFMESSLYQDYIGQYLSPSAQLDTNIKIMGSIKVPVPPSGLLKQYRRIVEPLMDQIEILIDMNYKLKTARDLLLPGLFKDKRKYCPGE